MILLAAALSANGQSYTDSIVAFRKHYTAELLADKRHPIRPSQVRYLNFFTPDTKYRVWASFTMSAGSKPFLVPTHSGKQKPFREYGTLLFTLNSSEYVLHVYQSVDLINDAAHRDDLFLPFNDETNYETSYPGGRYIDLTTNDIVDNKVLLDFNKCYNPYCAYADGFSCPVPPSENSLHVEIRAGEKMFIR